MTFDEVKYTIVGFDRATGRLSVVYYELDYVSEIDLHLTPEGKYPEGSELDMYIRMMCPLHIINRKIAVREGIPNEDSILNLVQDMPDHVNPLTSQSPAKFPPF